MTFGDPFLDSGVVVAADAFGFRVSSGGFKLAGRGAEVCIASAPPIKGEQSASRIHGPGCRAAVFGLWVGGALILVLSSEGTP